MAEWAHRAQHPQATRSAARPRPRAPEHQLTKLQRQAGNRAVAAFVNALTVQRVIDRPTERPFADLLTPRGYREGDGPSHAIGVIQQQLNAVRDPTAPRLAITGRFDAETVAATRAFQRKLIAERIAGVMEDGVVYGVTHAQLKARAPAVKVSGSDTVVAGPGNTQIPKDPQAGKHKVLRAGAKGVAVSELQERLNNSGKTTTALTVNGDFGPETEAALKEFQAGVKLASTGIADPATWSKLVAAGAASRGHEEFSWREEVEGVIAGGRASYDWRLTNSALTITVGINFQKKQDGVEGRISQWLSDIKEIWSTFKAVNHSDPEKRSVDLNFEVKTGGNHHTVAVYQYDPKLAKKDRPRSRSNAGTWYTIDSRRSTAPHELGHLIGLADEYNRVEEHYVAITGEEPAVGNTEGRAIDAMTAAAGIRAKLPLDDSPTPPRGHKRWGTNLAGVITKALGRKQGGFSRLVAQEYETVYRTNVYDDIQQAFNDEGVHGFQENLTACVRPFLYSNRSLMGSMLTTPATGGGGQSAPDHQHPIEPRHVQPFVNILAREWALRTGRADVWKPERR